MKSAKSVKSDEVAHPIKDRSETNGFVSSKIYSPTLISCFSGREVEKEIPVCLQEKGDCPILPSFHKCVSSVCYMPDISLLAGATAVNKTKSPLS